MQKRRVHIDRKVKGNLLLLKVPRTNDKSIDSAQQLLTSLHALLGNNIVASSKYRHRISLEIAVVNKVIGFYVWVPEALRQYIEEQIYSQYPSVQIRLVKDYVSVESVTSQLTSEIRLDLYDGLPIKLGAKFKIDPLLSLTATLAELTKEESAWIQIIITPAYDSWHTDAREYSEHLKSPSVSLIRTILGAQSTDLKPTEVALERSKAVAAKNELPAYQTTIRIVYRGNAKLIQAKIRLQAIAAAFMQFNTPNLNSFKNIYLGNKDEYVGDYHLREPSNYISILSTQELAGIYHLPYKAIDTPNIAWADSKIVEPPANLPTITDDTPDGIKSEISPIAYTNYRDNKTVFGLPRSDRSRHLYILGQTGVGKSALLELLTIADINSPYGFAIIDPHGDYAVNVLRRIPKDRIDDVIYINPADVEYPVSFNPLEVHDDRHKNHICSELLTVLKPVFENWNPRLEYTLRNAILALLDFPSSTMLDIPRLISDDKFRNQVVDKVDDKVVAHFWSHEFEQWNQEYSQIAVEPIMNKIGAFTTNPIIKNIIGHPKSSFNIRKIMDDRKILIVNLSQGLIGEENAALLGSLLVSSIQRAAMSRASIEDIDKRIPFYLYVDEFQNFATDSFKTILSEARKYGLILTVANQYIDQMSLGVQEAIFGNVGSMIAFRLSANDALSL
ncbi:MAG TPA: DUF87 domain-containing protein, partial [Candidatus Saccharimonadales bacterium]|nr:DUF87 domain-containing protein [Candidatus Saccharimonadales bacterium]